MSQRGPTLAELRERVHKERHQEIGNWLARRVMRPLAVHGTWLAVRLGVSANQVTGAALVANVLAGCALAGGTRWAPLFAVSLLLLGFWLDHVDGQVARWHGTASLTGVYLDYLMHYASAMAVGFGLGFGLAWHDGSLLWAVAGFLIAVGWTLLSLHNDCRYKAFMQRLKASTQRYTVEGGSGGRPEPAPAVAPGVWNRARWLAAKLCEPHAVLGVVGLLAVLAYLPGADWWLWGWRVYAAGMAVLAPGLALARVVRAARAHGPEQEFTLWFRPIDRA